MPGWENCYMTFEKLLFIGIIFCYSLGTLGIFLGTLAMRRPVKIAANWFTLLGFGLHTIAAVTTLVTEHFTELSAGYFMQLFSWCIIFLYLCAWRWLRLPFLALTAAPLALLLFALSLRMSQVQSVLPEHLAGLFMGLHIWSLFLSLGLLAMAFGAGILFVYMEGKIKSKTPIAEFARDFPALTTYDKVNQAAVAVGFPLYTLGLMSGFIWSPLLLQTVENPKVILSLFIWFMYAVLFYQRMALGYRGRKTALLAIAIFTISAVSVGIDYTISHHGVQLQP